jgi:hypothetical protein
MIRWECRHCGTRATMDDDAAGLKTRCPGCGAVGRVPDPGDSAARRRLTARGYVVRMVVWVLCLMGVASLALEQTTGSRRDVSAFQQAARAAETTAYCLLGYVFCRAVEGVVVAAEQRNRDR